MSQVVIISGPPAAGKSSVAEALCERYDRTVHLETDPMYAAIRMGFIKPWLHGSGRQNEMVTRAVARAATAFAAEQFAVFIDGVIGPHLLPIYLEELSEADVPIHLVVLRATLEEILHRGLTREETLRVAEPQLEQMQQQFVEWGAFAGVTIDNGGLTADQTADLVMEACGSGEAMVYEPSRLQDA